MKLIVICLLVTISSFKLIAHDELPWPAEDRDQAERLFTSTPNSILNQRDWSGAHWNAQSNQLFLCRDNGEVRIYKKEDDNWNLENRFEISGINLEGITQTGQSEKTFLIIDEGSQQIKQYKFEADTIEIIKSWDVSDLVEDDDGLEGIVFIPDGSLKNVFTAKNGELYQQNSNWLGGLVFVAYQENGNIYALDLNPDGTKDYLGSFGTHLKNTRGLEFDQSTNILYAIDRDGFVALKLSSRRVMDVVELMDSPGPEGVEGLALTPSTSESNWLITTDDDNNENDGAVLQYHSFEYVPILK